MFQITVTGSREIADRSYVYAILDYEITEFMLAGRGEIFLRLGDNCGVDAAAVQWARDRGVPHAIYFSSSVIYESHLSARKLMAENCEEFAAESAPILAGDVQHDGGIGSIVKRNAAMLKDSELLIAIHDGASIGTQNARDQARQHGVFIHLWQYPPSDTESSVLGALLSGGAQ